MYHIVETDIVVVGAGAAGTMAAIKASHADAAAKIVVLDKSKMETSGGAGRGMDALNTMSVPPYSYPEDVVEHTTKVTEGVLDQNIAYEFGKRCPQLIEDLEKIMGREKGSLFPVDDEGNYQLYYLHPIQKPLLLPMDGEEMKRALAKAVRDTGAKVYDRTAALQIITENNTVKGIFAFNVRSGDYYYFKTKSVCLTTGCAARMGLASSGYLMGCYEFPGNAGDGYYMAYQAGAELVNMECFQANSLIKDHQGPGCGYVAAPRGAYGTDKNGTPVWSHGYSSGDSKMGAWKTFAEGRGPTHLKMSHLPEETIQIIEKILWGNERTSRKKFHENRGQNYRNGQAIELAFAEEIGVCGGHSSSGVLSDVNGASSVKGLYVAGDVDGGLPHSYLGGALVMGGLIGAKAAEYSSGLTSSFDYKGIKKWIKNEIDTFEEPLRRDDGLPTDLVEYKARTRIQYYMKPPKNPEFLETAAWWMDRIRKEDLPRIKAVDYHDLLKTYEIECILAIGEIMARTSLYRTESRWGYQHWRVDIPENKPEWAGQWVVVKNQNNSINLSKRKVPDLKWDFATNMEYMYPKLSFDVGTPFKKEANWVNPKQDRWMARTLEKQGMATPRKFMPVKEK
jgi:succinate dehydrogenase/fumarate reductase flavoprotein subunit